MDSIHLKDAVDVLLSLRFVWLNAQDFCGFWLIFSDFELKFDSF